MGSLHGNQRRPAPFLAPFLVNQHHGIAARQQAHAAAASHASHRGPKNSYAQAVHSGSRFPIGHDYAACAEPEHREAQPCRKELRFVFGCGCPRKH